jgi:hypothetical protein
VLKIMNINAFWEIAPNHDARSGSNLDSTLGRTLLTGPRTPWILLQKSA